MSPLYERMMQRLCKRARKKGWKAGDAGASKGPPYLVIPMTEPIIAAWWGAYDQAFKEGGRQRPARGAAA